MPVSPQTPSLQTSSPARAPVVPDTVSKTAAPQVTVKRSRARKTPGQKSPDQKSPDKTSKVAAETSTAAQANASAGVGTTPPELTGMIATAAYFIAAQRNFAPGRELDDWLEAERHIMGRLKPRAGLAARHSAA